MYALVGLFRQFAADEAQRSGAAHLQRRRLVVDASPLRTALADNGAGFVVGALFVDNPFGPAFCDHICDACTC